VKKITWFGLLVFILSCGDPQSSSNESTSEVIDGQSTAYHETSSVPPETVDPNYMWAGRGELNQFFQSSITGVNYDYHVYIPPEYDLEPDRKFPVMYVTDAQFDTTFQAQMLDFMQLPVIMVSIGEGPPRRRATDYILPGVQQYFNFFTEEFIPHIENQYRIDPTDRTIQGNSAGGTACVAFLILDEHYPSIFKNHICMDPYNTPSLFNLLQLRVDSGVILEKTLFISSAGGNNGFETSVRRFLRQLRSHHIAELEIVERHYNVSHSDIVWASLEDAYSTVFQE
jgi:enterochelin esterase-like enzyme